MAGSVDVEFPKLLAHIIDQANSMIRQRVKYVMVDFEPENRVSISSHIVGIYQLCLRFEWAASLIAGLDSQNRNSYVAARAIFSEIAAAAQSAALLPVASQMDALIEAGIRARVHLLRLRRSLEDR